MRILKLSPYYFPEKVSSTHLTSDLEKKYVEAGFDITIIAPRPTRGISLETYNEYKNKTYEEKYNGKIKIYRFKMFREKKNSLLRAIRYFLVQHKQYRKALKLTDIDVIFAGSTPPTQGMMCCKIAKKLSKKLKKKVPVVFSLQDVFPDSLVSAGMTKKGSLIWKIGRKIENYTYKNVDEIVVISEDIKNNILEKGVPEEKINLIYNWIDTAKVRPVFFEDNNLARELNIKEDKFRVVYAGNLGKAQACSSIIETANLLKDETNIEFYIFGNGNEEEKVKELANNYHLLNVHFYPLQSLDRVSEVYSIGDVCIISCKKGTGIGAFPSKTASILATGTPILASFDNDSELCRIIKNNGIGFSIDPENPEALAQSIKDAKNNLSETKMMGVKCREFAESHFDINKCTNSYIELLIKTINNKESNI